MRKLKINIILVSTALLMLGFSCSENRNEEMEKRKNEEMEKRKNEEMEKRKKMEWENKYAGCPPNVILKTFATIKKINGCYYIVNENSQFKKGSQIEKTMLIPLFMPNKFKKDGLKVYIEYCKEFSMTLEKGQLCKNFDIKNNAFISISKIKEL